MPSHPDQSRLNVLLEHIERIQGGAYRRLEWDHLRQVAFEMLHGHTFLNARFNNNLHLARARLFDTLGEAQAAVSNAKAMLWPDEAAIRTYSRCAPPKTPVLYTTDNFDTALSEVRPIVNQFVCIGHIQAKQSVYAVAIGEIDLFRRTGLTRFANSKEHANQAYSNGATAALLLDAFLNSIMSAPSTHQANYKLSSAFCDAIWNPPGMEVREGLRPQESLGENAFALQDLVSCISYSSVAHNGGSNFAFKPEAYEKRLSLERCAIWKILEDFGYGIFRKELVAVGSIDAKSGAIAWSKPHSDQQQR